MSLFKNSTTASATQISYPHSPQPFTLKKLRLIFSSHCVSFFISPMFLPMFIEKMQNSIIPMASLLISNHIVSPHAFAFVFAQKYPLFLPNRSSTHYYHPPHNLIYLIFQISCSTPASEVITQKLSRRDKYANCTYQ